MKSHGSLREGREGALREWSTLLGEERVKTGTDIDTRYTRSDLYKKRSVLGVLFPETTAEVVAVVTIASKYAVPLYPISTGNNYGYGGALPSSDSCVVVDLSRMNKIVSFDDHLGLITVEPGVTTREVRTFLRKNRSRYIAPVIGGAFSHSMIGNALEKGRSKFPLVDRLSSLMSLEAVLSDGSIYQSYLFEQGGFFKWGVGPYLDGLFSQSNFGVVTKATFALTPIPEHALGFFFVLEDKESFPVVIDQMRKEMKLLGDVFASVEICNPQRILRKIQEYEPIGRNGSHHKSPAEFEWAVIGLLQGETRMVVAAKSHIKKGFREYAGHVVFFDHKLTKFSSILSKFGYSYGHHTSLFLSLLPSLQSLVSISGGERPESHIVETGMNTLFIPIILPMDGEKVSQYIKSAEKECTEHDFGFACAILNFDSRCLFLNLALEFEDSHDNKADAITRCYKTLCALAEESGGHVYRTSIDTMDMVNTSPSSFWQLAKKIKSTLDPANIIAPGRYLPK